MIAGASDATVAVYDVQRATDYVEGCQIEKHNSIFVINKQHEHGHKYAISSATWYPVDTGLFITGSYDHHINVWDTNTTQVNCSFLLVCVDCMSEVEEIDISHLDIKNFRNVRNLKVPYLC